MEENRERGFFRDGTRNYMVMAYPPGGGEEYQYRMLAANQIRGLLTCSRRSIDNQDYLYYDITSRQSLADLFDRRQVRGRDLERLLGDLLRMEDILTEYLLDITRLVLDPACIYADFREQEYSFAYYPGEEEKADWQALFLFLADRVDGKDKHAAALIYKLCMMAEKPGFCLQRQMLEELGMDRLPVKKGGTAYRAGTAMYAGPLNGGANDMEAFGRFPVEKGASVLDEIGIGGNGRVANDRGAFSRFSAEKGAPGRGTFDGGTNGRGECSWFSAGTGASGRGTVDEGTNGRDAFAGAAMERRVSDRGVIDTGMGGGGGETPELMKNTGRQNPGRTLPAAIALTIVGTGMLASGLFLQLEETAMILSRAIGSTLTACGCLLFIVMLARYRRQNDAKDARKSGREGNKQDRKEKGRKEKGRKERDRKAQDMEENMSGGQSGYGYGRAETYESGADWFGFAPLDQDAGSAGYSERLGETTLLGPDTGRQAALYGVGACRGEQIQLQSLPCVVGKMREYVDQVLDDAAISRMHARFSRDREGKMTVRDLNSTNGTWLNGERLQPNEIRVLEQGDHLKLGNMEFVFR